MPRRGGEPSDPAELERVVRRSHPARTARLLEREPGWARDFANLSYEWRRPFSELFGTSILVVAAAGAAVLDADPWQRREGPDVVRGDLGGLWIYLLGPLAGTVLAVTAAYIGRGGGPAASKATQRSRTTPSTGRS
ncbi:MAG: hypothetical protein ACR2JQ_12765 [Mycobacteriales bacterium]